MLLALAFISYSLPPYLTLDPSRSRVAPPSSVPGYYPALVAHVVSRIHRHDHSVPAGLALGWRPGPSLRCTAGWGCSTSSVACCPPA